jgi:DNA segregation ATPase FtsK/SpoIIIE-like protein
VNEAEYNALEPLYAQAQMEVPALPHITTSAVQRLYMIGYNRAARLLEHLAEHGFLKRDQYTGAYSALTR